MRENYDSAFDVSEDFVVRPAIRLDPDRDFLFDLAGGVIAIGVVALGGLVFATQALRWLHILH